MSRPDRPDATSAPRALRQRHVRAIVGLVTVALLLAGALTGLSVRGVAEPAAWQPPSSASDRRLQDAIATGRFLFIGASYTVGLGATTPRDGYAPVLATRLDRRYTVAAVAGTGFLNPGPHHQGTFAQRMAALPATLDPRIVVIQGGRNDVGYPLPQLQAAVRTTITTAQQRFREAQVVVMGPIPAVVPVSSRLLQARNVVRAAARQTGAGFVDPIAQGWITSQNERVYAGPVPAHPNDAGYQYIAVRLLVDLPAALEQSRAPMGETTSEASSSPAAVGSASPTAPTDPSDPTAPTDPAAPNDPAGAEVAAAPAVPETTTAEAAPGE